MVSGMVIEMHMRHPHLRSILLLSCVTASVPAVMRKRFNGSVKCDRRAVELTSTVDRSIDRVFKLVLPAVIDGCIRTTQADGMRRCIAYAGSRCPLAAEITSGRR